jgi:hypothetical protein
MTDARIIIVGGPRVGKSTLAFELAFEYTGIQHHVYCGDPESLVKQPQRGVHYLPEGIPISGDQGAAQWISDNWLTMPGPWVLEGWIMARALRRWLGRFDIGGAPPVMPCDRIIVLHDIHPEARNVLPGHVAMGKAVQTVWRCIAHNFEGIVEDRYQ